MVCSATRFWVMKASLPQECIQVYRDSIVPLADILTPNEAS
jgi:pyridoxal/pyridoxine/pyridoxamine kinase